MGNSGMDLQSILGKTTKLLLLPNDLMPVVYYYPCSQKTFYRHQVVIEINLKGRIVRSSSSARAMIQVYIKAVSELGECLLRERMNLHTRSGIAGGFLTSNAVMRAKAELLERDAFFYHYRGRFPFLSKETLTIKGNEIHLCKMATQDKSYHSYIAFHADYLNGKCPCLIFGTGTHLDATLARERALDEFSSLFMNHEHFPEWCPGLNGKRMDEVSLADWHHQASKDKRNQQIMSHLCSVQCSDREIFNEQHWEIKELISPLRGFKFVYVSHPQLSAITFGEEEKSEAGLYHPFW